VNAPGPAGAAIHAAFPNVAVPAGLVVAGDAGFATEAASLPEALVSPDAWYLLPAPDDPAFSFRRPGRVFLLPPVRPITSDPALPRDRIPGGAWSMTVATYDAALLLGHALRSRPEAGPEELRRFVEERGPWALSHGEADFRDGDGVGYRTRRAGP
jgi:hypothetical protein